MKKRAWLLLWFTPLLVPAMLGLTTGLRYLVREPDEQYVGAFLSEAEGERAAIRNLTEQINRWPKAQNYAVARIQLNPHRTGIEAEWPVRTYYHPGKGLLFDERNLFSTPWEWGKVTPQKIKDVDKANGIFADFAGRAEKTSEAWWAGETRQPQGNRD